MNVCSVREKFRKLQVMETASERPVIFYKFYMSAIAVRF